MQKNQTNNVSYSKEKELTHIHVDPLSSILPTQKYFKRYHLCILFKIPYTIKPNHIPFAQLYKTKHHIRHIGSTPRLVPDPMVGFCTHFCFTFQVLEVCGGQLAHTLWQDALSPMYRPYWSTTHPDQINSYMICTMQYREGKKISQLNIFDLNPFPKKLKSTWNRP